MPNRETGDDRTRAKIALKPRMVQSLAKSIATPLAAALWATGIVAIFIRIDWLDQTRLIMLAAFMAIAVVYASRLTRIVCLTAAVAIAAYGLTGDVLTPIAEGLGFSLIFTVFLPALILIREVVDISPEMSRARQAFAELSDQQRDTGLIIGAQVLGVVVTLGALALTAPLIARDTPMRQRIATAVAVLRGISLCVLWSPFTVGIAFVLTTKPSVTLYQVLIAGLCLALVGTLIAVGLSSGWRGVRTLHSPLRAFRSLYWPIGAVIVSVVAFAQLTPLSSLQSVSILMPVLCVARLITLRPTALQQALRSTWSTLAATGNEILLFTSAVTLGLVATTAGLAEKTIDWLTLDQLPDAVYLALLLILGPLLGLAGMHSVLIGTITASLLAPMDARYPDIIEAMVILFNWMSASCISFGSLSVGVATRLFNVDVKQLVFSSNIGFVLCLTTVTIVLMEVWLRMV